MLRREEDGNLLAGVAAKPMSRFFYRIFYRILRYGPLRSVTRQQPLPAREQVRVIIGHKRGPPNMASHNPKVEGSNPSPATN